MTPLIKKVILKPLWTIAVWSRVLTGKIFVVAINLLLLGTNFDLEDIFYKIQPLFFTSLFLHFIYIVVYFIFSNNVIFNFFEIIR
jgi:hypothetical protein